MKYRTKTYIAADWTGDSNAVEQLHKCNNSRYCVLSFQDAHDITQSNDRSKNCSIKASLRRKLDISKTFVLIVGNETKSRRSGECNDCFKNNECNNISNKSFIEYECDKAVRDGINIVVLYNAAMVNRFKCPDILRDKGTHIAMCYSEDRQLYWDYKAVKNAIG